MTFLGIVSIFYLMVIAGDLYVTVCRPFSAEAMHEDGRVMFWSNFFPWSFSLFWSVAPLAGWSSYALEDDQLRCSIDWNGKSLGDKTYISFLFVFCYLIPLGMLAFCYILVKRELHKMHERAAAWSAMQSPGQPEGFRAERKHTKLAIAMTTAYVVSWTPYTVLSFWSSFFKHVSPVPIHLGTVTALFAKMSTIINPIIYAFLHARFRHSVSIPFFGRVFKEHNNIHSFVTNTNNNTSNSMTRNSVAALPGNKL